LLSFKRAQQRRHSDSESQVILCGFLPAGEIRGQERGQGKPFLFEMLREFSTLD